MLAAIVDRCLAVDPGAALRERARGARRLGRSRVAFGPAADDGFGGDRAGAAAGGGAVVCLAGVQHGGVAIERGVDGSRRWRATVSPPSTSRGPPATSWIAATRWSKRWPASKPFRRQLAEMLAKPDVQELLVKLSDPKRNPADLEPQRNRVPRSARPAGVAEGVRAPWFRRRRRRGKAEHVASWFFCDANGVIDRANAGRPHARQKLRLAEFLPRRRARHGRDLAALAGRTS